MPVFQSPSLVDLAGLAGPCYRPDGGTHTFPVHHSVHRLFKTRVPRVLQIVVIPQYCSRLEWLGYNQPTFFADTQCVLNEFDLRTLVKNCIALKEVLD